MAYSKNPLNYPSTMERLILAFELGPDEMIFDFPTRHDAYLTQMRFYAYIRACLHTRMELQKRKQPGWERWERLETIARTRQVELRVSLNAKGWQLIFRRRDAEPTTLLIAKQLAEMNIASHASQTVDQSSPWKEDNTALSILGMTLDYSTPASLENIPTTPPDEEKPTDE